jgi:hypothetical protein
MNIKPTAWIMAALSAQLMADPAPQPRVPGIPHSQPLHQDDKRQRQRDEGADGTHSRERPAGNPGFRTIDGYGNHSETPELGTPDRPFVRLFEPAYGDGVESPAGEDRASARVIVFRCSEEASLVRFGGRLMTCLPSPSPCRSLTLRVCWQYTKPECNLILRDGSSSRTFSPVSNLGVSA